MSLAKEDNRIRHAIKKMIRKNLTKTSPKYNRLKNKKGKIANKKDDFLKYKKICGK